MAVYQRIEQHPLTALNVTLCIGQGSCEWRKLHIQYAPQVFVHPLQTVLLQGQQQTNPACDCIVMELKSHLIHLLIRC
uniref:Uncharacterized protein n=1 Tax=Arundo donax TaxID=35708 RepID=A0A0A9CUP3_ARUDO